MGVDTVFSCFAFVSRYEAFKSPFVTVNSLLCLHRQQWLVKAAVNCFFIIM